MQDSESVGETGFEPTGHGGLDRGLLKRTFDLVL